MTHKLDSTVLRREADRTRRHLGAGGGGGGDDDDDDDDGGGGNGRVTE